MKNSETIADVFILFSLSSKPDPLSNLLGGTGSMWAPNTNNMFEDADQALGFGGRLLEAVRKGYKTEYVQNDLTTGEDWRPLLEKRFAGRGWRTWGATSSHGVAMIIVLSK